MGEDGRRASRLLAHDGLADIAVDEEPRAVLGEPFERLGEIGVAEGLAGLAAACRRARRSWQRRWLAVRIGAMTVKR